jgi:hypothetical protein
VHVGHATWITPLVAGGVFLIRYLASPRRRQGHRGDHHQRQGQGQSTTGSSFAGRSGPTRLDEGPRAGSGAHAGIGPGWFRDPFLRHEQRYWSGTEWTGQVTDDGIPRTDPPPPAPGPTESPES